MPQPFNPYAGLAGLANRPERQSRRDAIRAAAQRERAKLEPSCESAAACEARVAAAIVAGIAFGTAMRANADYRGTSPTFDGHTPATDARNA
jgi:hypothetical protein